MNIFFSAMQPVLWADVSHHGTFRGVFLKADTMLRSVVLTTWAAYADWYNGLIDWHGHAKIKIKKTEEKMCTNKNEFDERYE